jgi:hypothetical protein
MTILTIQPSETNALDAFIANGTYASTNYGTASLYYIGRASTGILYRGCIKFDLSGFPSGAVINAVKLSLTVNAAGASSNTVAIHRLLVDWLEAEVTWNARKTGTNWSTAGAFDSTSCDLTELTSVVIPSSTSAGSKIDFTLPVSTMQELVNGQLTNNGFLIKGTESGDTRVNFYNSNAATESQRPALEIEYYFPQGIIML